MSVVELKARSEVDSARKRQVGKVRNLFQPNWPSDRGESPLPESASLDTAPPTADGT
jgi:hypothetical protein